MSKALRYTAVIFAVVVAAFAAAQLVQPDFNNPPVDRGRTLQAQLGASDPLVSIVGRACRDCHSNQTRWPSYTRVAPLSWLMSYGVKKGRDIVNFSDWGGYTVAQRQELMAVSCSAVSKRTMTGSIYIYLHPEAQLSQEDIATICNSARQASTQR